MNDSVYLDNNATTPLAPEVAQAITQCMSLPLANPASQHSAGRAARRRLDDARDRIIQLLGGSSSDSFVFTSGGTESNNLAVLGLAGNQPGTAISSQIEHPSVTASFSELARRGFDVVDLRVRPDGTIDLEHFREVLTPAVRVVSVMAANHETGVVQPVADIGKLCCEAKVPFHCDAAQAVGKMRFSFAEFKADTISVTPHKFHGPLGIGGLLIRNGAALQPLLHGGPQQLGLRPGTENTALAVGFHLALELALQRLDDVVERLSAYRDRLEQRLSDAIPDLVIHGRSACRLANTSNVAFPVNRQTMLMALDLAGVACSTGSACASGSSEASPVLRAMGVENHLVEGSLRFSFGGQLEAPDGDRATDRILCVFKDLCRAKHGGI